MPTRCGVPREGHSFDDAALIARPRTLLAASKCPRQAFRVTALPQNQLGKVIRGELRLPCGFLRRDPVGDLKPRKGRGLVTIMERPLEGSGRCLDLNHTAGQFQDLVANRRPRRSVNGKDLDGRAFAEHTPPAPAEVQASRGDRRHA